MYSHSHRFEYRQGTTLLFTGYFPQAVRHGLMLNTLLHLPMYYFMAWIGAKLPFNHLPMSDTYIKLHTGKLNAVNIYAKFLRKKETHKKERKNLLYVEYYAIECINSRCIQLSSVIVRIYAKM
jgi:hypothetical protein